MCMSSEQTSVGVFLLAENRLLRDVFARMLARRSDIRIVGTAAFSPIAVQEVLAAAPELVLFDSLTAALSTDGLLLELRRMIPGLKVVMFGMDCDQEKFLLAVH